MKEKFEKTLDSGYDFDMGLYIKDGWKLFGKGAGSFIGFTIMTLAIAFIMNLIPYVNYVGYFVQTALSAGVFIFCRNLLNRKDDFTDFFKGFNSMGQLTLYLITFIIFFIPIIVVVFSFIFPFELLPDLMSGNVDNVSYAAQEIADRMFRNMPSILLVYLAIFLASVYLYMAFSFVVPLIVDAKLDFWSAITISRMTINKNLLGFFAMFMLLFILAIIGIIFTCGLGTLVVIPFFSCVVFSAYDHILKPHADDLSSELQAFGSQQKDVNTESEDKN